MQIPIFQLRASLFLCLFTFSFQISNASFSNDLPIVALASSGETCEGSTIVLTASAAGGSGTYIEYTWKKDGMLVGENSASYVINSAGLGDYASYSVSVLDDNGQRSEEASIDIVIYPRPVPSITGPLSTCFRSVQNYSSEYGMNNYIWTVTGGTIVGGVGTASVDVLWSEIGNQSISVIYDAYNGCSADMPGFSIVTVEEVPAPVIEGKNTACYGTTEAYTFDSDSYSYYSCRVTGGTLQSDDNNGRIEVLWNTWSVGQIELNYTRPNGCVGVTYFNVAIVNRPTPIISGDKEVCAYSSATYSTEDGYTSYQWGTSGGEILSGQGTSSVEINWGGSGKDTVWVNVMDDTECRMTGSTMEEISLKTSVISGRVLSQSNPVAEGDALVQLKDISESPYSIIDEVLVGVGGVYSFASVNPGDYVLFVKVGDQSKQDYQGVMDTYYSSAFKWTDASLITVGCQDLELDIEMCHTSVISSGSGRVSGQIFEAFNGLKSSSQYIEGINVFLIDQAGGEVVSFQKTDASGRYLFENLANGDYYLHIDFAGINQTSTHYITLSEGQPEINSLDFEIGNEITAKEVATRFDGVQFSAPDAMFFPNPVDETVYVRYQQSDLIKIQLYSMDGSLIKSVNFESVGANDIRFDVSDVNAGSYIIQLISGEHLVSRKLIIK